MTDNKYPPCRVHITRHGPTKIVCTTWVTIEFEGKDDYVALGNILGEIGTLESLRIKLQDGSNLVLPKGLIQQCSFIMKEDV